MRELSVPELLSHFDFATEWWEYEFVDEAYLRALHAQFQESDDKSREHYRYRAFRDALKNESLIIRSVFVDQYIYLADLDPDRAMAGAALHDLLMSPAITPDQVGASLALPSFSEAHLQKAAEQHFRRVRKT